MFLPCCYMAHSGVYLNSMATFTLPDREFVLCLWARGIKLDTCARVLLIAKLFEKLHYLNTIEFSVRCIFLEIIIIKYHSRCCICVISLLKWRIRFSKYMGKVWNLNESVVRLFIFKNNSIKHTIWRQLSFCPVFNSCRRYLISKLRSMINFDNRWEQSAYFKKSDIVSLHTFDSTILFTVHITCNISCLKPQICLAADE